MRPFTSQAGQTMASWQTQLLNLALHLTLKRMMSASGTVEAARRMIENRREVRMPPGCTRTAVAAHAFRGEWISNADVAEQCTVLYLPGGGFVLPASAQVPLLCTRINHEARSRCLLVHYRLAPEHPFPAGLDDCIAAYKYLLEIGTDPASIVIAGDSAGGGLTLSTLLALRDDGLPLPAGAVLISPFTDFTLGGASMRSNGWRDPMFSAKGMDQMGALYLRGTAADHPLVSPVYGDYRGLPPILAHVGSTELLLDDTKRVGRKARAQGVDFEVEVWADVPHVWHIWPFLPESQMAVRRIGGFIRLHTQAARWSPSPAPQARRAPARRKVAKTAKARALATA